MITVATMMKKFDENGGKFPVGMSNVFDETAVIEAAKVELRRVAMVLHNEARAILQNVFLCPADVADAVAHIGTAHHALTEILISKPIINALNLPNK